MLRNIFILVVVKVKETQTLLMAFNRCDKFKQSDSKGSLQSNQQIFTFGPQPARILLLDSSLFLEEWFGKIVIEALEKIFLLSSNLNGNCPIPLIGIYLLTIYPELILPLSHTKSNFARLHSALGDLHNFIFDHGKLQQSKHSDCCVIDGIAEACRQFRRYSGNLPVNSKNFHQLEIIFMTTRQEKDVKKHFTTLPDQADTDIIKRIICANISSVFNDISMDSPDAALDLMNDDFTGLVDMILLEADPVSLQKFMYSWLNDNTFDSEQLQLILPSPSPVETQIVIKCDLTERIINTLQLPVHSAFSLDMKTNACKHVFPPPSKSLGAQVPVFQLKVLNSIPRQNVCDSIMFGQPLVVQPTACWKMEWESLEKNQQMFHALCLELLKKDHVLLTCSLHQGQNNNCNIKTDGYGTSPHSVQPNSFGSVTFSNKSDKLSGYFILMPSEKSILIKSIACGELYLPSNQSPPASSASEENQLCIQSSLSKVEELSIFNPMDFQCGLFGALKSVSLPKNYFNKARQLPQQRMQKSGQNKVNRTSVISPGGRLTASSWSSTITDVKGSQNKNNQKPGKLTRSY